MHELPDLVHGILANVPKLNERLEERRSAATEFQEQFEELSEGLGRLLTSTAFKETLIDSSLRAGLPSPPRGRMYDSVRFELSRTSPPQLIPSVTTNWGTYRCSTEEEFVRLIEDVGLPAARAACTDLLTALKTRIEAKLAEATR
jgi:hypothetical protein